MAASLLIEHDHGTYSGAVRSKHQGYYAGDFRTQAIAPHGADAATSSWPNADMSGRFSNPNHTK